MVPAFVLRCASEYPVPKQSTSNGRFSLYVYKLHRVSRMSGGHGRVGVQEKFFGEHPPRSPVSVAVLSLTVFWVLSKFECDQNGQKETEECDCGGRSTQNRVHPTRYQTDELVSDTAVKFGFIVAGRTVLTSVTPERFADAGVQFGAFVLAVPTETERVVLIGQILWYHVLHVMLLQVTSSRSRNFQPV